MMLGRCYDGKRFVYAFYYDEDIYVVSPDHKSIQRVKVKSQYIDKVKQLNDYVDRKRDARIPITEILSTTNIEMFITE